MKQTFLILFILSSAVFSFGQETAKSFPETVAANIKLYNVYSNVAYDKGDLEKGQYLFDTLVSNQLAGTKFENYTFRKIYGGKLTLSSVKKPLLIQTYTSWCVLGKGEIQALNKISTKYIKTLQIVVLFWDKKKDAKNIAHQFNNNIEVCFATESSNNDAQIVATMKYAIGYLTAYYLDENLNVITIKKGSATTLPLKTPLKDCIRHNYDFFEKNILDLMLKYEPYKNKKPK